MNAVPPQAGTYRAILADPPWRFSTYSDKGKGRSAEAHYDCMTLPEIKAMPVADWAAKDAVLFLWTTDPMLRHALDVVAAWGFTYKTVAFYWVKLNRNRGGLFLGPRDFFETRVIEYQNGGALNCESHCALASPGIARGRESRSSRKY